MKARLLSLFLLLGAVLAKGQTTNPYPYAEIKYGFTNKVVSGNTVTYSFTMMAGNGYQIGQNAYGNWTATNFRVYAPDNTISAISFTPAPITGLAGSGVQMAANSPVGNVSNTMPTVDKFQLSLTRNPAQLPDLSATVPLVVGAITFTLVTAGAMPALTQFPYDDTVQTDPVKRWNNGFGSFWTDNDVDTYRQPWVAGTSPGPLPLQLLEFNATIMDRSTRLNWITSKESKSDYFGIERSSDAQHWSSIGKVAAHGTGRYRHTDAQPSTRINYYRLKIADFDGSFTYSPIRTVDFGNPNATISMYPNPAKENLTLVGTEAGMTVTITGMNGQLMGNFKVDSYKITIGVSNFAPGHYVVHVLSARGALISAQKLVKE